MPVLSPGLSLMVAGLSRANGRVDGTAYNYTLPMVIFASCGIAAMLLGLWLKAEDRKKNYGLELPNIKK